MKLPFIPFTYIITSSDGHLYVGCKYGKDSHPSVLLTKYFTSSKYAKPLILQDPSKWTIFRLEIGKTIEEVVERELLWQEEFRHHKGLLNKLINRGSGKFVWHGKRPEEFCKAVSERMKGNKPSQHTIDAMKKANTGRKISDYTKGLLRELQLGRPKSELTRQKISESLIRAGVVAGANNANTTRWVLKDPNGNIFEQPKNQTGKLFIESLGLSYQMLLKFRRNNLPFSGGLKGWEVISCNRVGYKLLKDNQDNVDE